MVFHYIENCRSFQALGIVNGILNNSFADCRCAGISTQISNPVLDELPRGEYLEKVCQPGLDGLRRRQPIVLHLPRNHRVRPLRPRFPRINDVFVVKFGQPRNDVGQPGYLPHLEYPPPPLGCRQPWKMVPGLCCDLRTSCITPGSSAWCHVQPAGGLLGARPVGVLSSIIFNSCIACAKSGSLSMALSRASFAS